MSNPKRQKKLWVAKIHMSISQSSAQSTQPVRILFVTSVTKGHKVLVGNQVFSYHYTALWRSLIKKLHGVR